MSKIFITFGGPTEYWYKRVDILCDQAKNMNFFDKVIGYTDKDLKQDEPFWSTHGQFIEQNERGYGHWLWKSYLIKKTLDQLNDGDILIYADSGCQLNNNGIPRLNEYMDMLHTNEDNYGVISFKMSHLLEKWYTKMELFTLLNTNEDDRNSPQSVGGIVLIKKNAHSVHLVNEWYTIASSNYDTINHNRYMEQDPEFCAHRDDQSVFSLLVKKYGSIKIEDETYFNDWTIGLKTYPILALRGRHISSI